VRDEGPRGTGNRPDYVPRVESRKGLALCGLAEVGSVFSTAHFDWHRVKSSQQRSEKVLYTPKDVLAYSLRYLRVPQVEYHLLNV
jgi:hypothetical protein